jgi:hypothetical protein
MAILEVIMLKGFFSSAVAVIALMVSGVSNAQEKYPSEREFYPAVYGAVAELCPEAKYLDIDFYNNSYTLTGVTGGRLLSIYSYDLTLRLQDNGEIDVQESNIYLRGKLDLKTKKYEWTKTTGFVLYNYKKDFEALKSRIILIGKNEANYKRFEKEAMSNIEFVYAIVQNFTELAFNDFAKNYIGESVFTVRGRVSDVEEFGQEINGTTYKYLVSLTQDLVDESTNTSSTVVLSGLSGHYLFCRLYTNRDNVIRMSKTATTTVKGKVVKASRSSRGSLALFLAEE